LKNASGQQRKYREFIDSERHKIKKVISQLSLEIKHAVSLHPLRDYLTAIESEISSKEVELVRIPTSHSARKILEGQVERLIKQKNQVKGLIEKTEAYLDKYKKQLRLGASLEIPDLPIDP
jgi:hypothetical protein